MKQGKSSTSKGVSTKRQAIREKRQQRERQQRLYILLGIVAVAIVIAAILFIPNLIPAGDFVQITPVSRPMVDGRSLGDPNAPVKIEVYEDFQCPACRSYSSDIEPQLIDNYVATGQVYYTYRHFPFLDDNSLRKESDQSANASMCASAQDRFWDYHDILFANWDGENQGAFSDKRLVAFAEAIGLEMNAFKDCFSANQFQTEIETDLTTGRNTGISGTPSILVNGRIISPGFVPNYEEISQAIEAALASPGS